MFQKNQARQSFRITKISYPLIRTRTYLCVSGGKKCSFFGKFGVLCFLETRILRFALLPYYQQTLVSILAYMLKGYIYLSLLKCLHSQSPQCQSIRKETGFKFFPWHFPTFYTSNNSKVSFIIMIRIRGGLTQLFLFCSL